MSRLWDTLLQPVRRVANRAAQWVRTLVSDRHNEPVRPRVYWDDDITLTLSNLVQEAETRASGRVQVISLADFRNAIGDLWEKYQSRILIIVDSTIGRMIGRGNTYIPQGDDGWLLLFPGLAEDKAQQRADAIAAAIGEKLMGARFIEHELPLPAAAKLDLRGALNVDGSLNMEAVKQAISRVKQAQISTAAGAKARATAPPAGGQSVGTMLRSTANQLQVSFIPAWSADTESIDTYFFRAMTAGGSDVYAQNAPSHNDATVLDLCRAAAAAFNAMCDSGLNAKMVIPVPFATLGGPLMGEIQRLIASLRQRERLLRLRIEVVQIPPSVTADILVAIREAFRAYVREVAFVVDLFAPHEQILVLDHVMLGVDVSDAGTLSDDAIFQDLLMFRQRAGRRGTYVLGLQSHAHLRRAINAGIGEVGGPALAEGIKRLPHRITIMQREQLLNAP